MNSNKTPSIYNVVISEDKSGIRLDRVLAEALPEFSRTRIRSLIESGYVKLNSSKKIISASDRVRAGNCYKVEVPPVVPAAPKPQNIALDIVFEDEDLIIINKPAGLVVHPSAGHADGTLVNALLAHCGDSLSGIGGISRPGIVHRLDKGTSGLLLVAKNDHSHKNLSKQLSERSLERAYKALVWGKLSLKNGKVEENIARSSKNRKKMAVAKNRGKFALTKYKAINPVGSLASLLECRLSTGRTHQIRVHLSYLGHPIIGDPIYSRGVRKKLPKINSELRSYISLLNHQMLHAFLIGVKHPRTEKLIRFEVDLPNDFKKVKDFLSDI